MIGVIARSREARRGRAPVADVGPDEAVVGLLLDLASEARLPA